MAGKFYMRVDDNRLGAFEREGIDAAGDAARDACVAGAAVARAAAPSDSGNLRGSIGTGRGVKGQYTIEAGVNYAAYQEFGVNGRFEGKHFLRKGILAAQKTWPELVDKRLPG